MRQKEFEFDKTDFFCFNTTDNKTIIKLFPLLKWNKIQFSYKDRETGIINYDLSSIRFLDAQLEFIKLATKYRNRIGNHETKGI